MKFNVQLFYLLNKESKATHIFVQGVGLGCLRIGTRFAVGGREILGAHCASMQRTMGSEHSSCPAKVSNKTVPNYI
jgi:hypothetical protein